jgi:hypothetical protein
LICPSSLPEAFVFPELGRKEVSFTAKMLAAVGDGWTTDICKEVEGLSVWIRIGVWEPPTFIQTSKLLGQQTLRSERRQFLYTAVCHSVA